MKRGLPRCPVHLNRAAAVEWRRVAKALHEAGVLTTFDRAALAAYCQAYGRWVEAEERLRETSMLIRTPSGHVQQSPLLGIVHKQLEIMGRYMVELGMTPAARSRVLASAPIVSPPAEPLQITWRVVDPSGREVGVRRMGWKPSGWQSRPTPLSAVRF